MYARQYIPISIIIFKMLASNIARKEKGDPFPRLFTKKFVGVRAHVLCMKTETISYPICSSEIVMQCAIYFICLQIYDVPPHHQQIRYDIFDEILIDDFGSQHHVVEEKKGSTGGSINVV